MENQPEEPLFPEADVARLIFLTLQGVHHIHENGIVHRDLKLANLLLSKDQSLRIIDFGVSLVVPKDPKEYNKEIVGSLAFMAPEIFKTKGAETSYTPAVDIWAIGIIMFNLLAGASPFSGYEEDEYKHSIMNDEVNYRRTDRIMNASDKAKSLIDKLCEKDPNERLTAE